MPLAATRGISRTRMRAPTANPLNVVFGAWMKMVAEVFQAERVAGKVWALWGRPQ